MTDQPFDPYHRWLGIPPKHQPPDYYRLLALERFEDDEEVIRDAAERQITHVRKYQLGEHADLSHKLLNELGRAKACLLNNRKRAEYDQELRAAQRNMSAPDVTTRTQLAKPRSSKRELPTPAPLIHSTLPTRKPDASGHNSSSHKPIIILLLVGSIACTILVTIGILVGRLLSNESSNPTTRPALAKDPVGKTAPSSSRDGQPANWTSVDWTVHGRRDWGASSGKDVIYVAKETSANSWLLSRRSFGDLVLTAKCAISEGGAGGIYVRVPQDARFPWNQGFEIHFADDYGKPPSIEGTGAVWKKAQPLSNQARPVNQWNDVRITCRGRDLAVWLNDECVVEYRIPDDFPTSGHIGLDGVTGGITYRDVRVQTQ